MGEVRAFPGGEVKQCEARSFDPGDLPSLEARLLGAHDAGDKAQLSRLYAEAADEVEEAEAAAFFLTQAYVYALDSGAPEFRRLHARLKALGREA
ncbi:MAG: hypothetical protein AAGJ91_03010 [Pseudomonadota bacterium]